MVLTAWLRPREFRVGSMNAPQPSRLYLLRHARSAWAEPGGRDHGRALDERGEGEAGRLGEILRERGVSFDRTVCSSALRARQTLDTIGLSLCLEPPRDSDDLYALGPDAYWSAVRAAGSARSLLVVGHNPTIEVFALSLAATEPAALEAGFPTCGLAIFEAPGAFDALQPGTARFVEALWP